MADNNCKLHIAMFPWLAFGHLIPFLELAKLMAARGHAISFISTPRNIHRLPQIPQTLADLIDFVKIDLPRVPNLPENAESTKDLPLGKVKYLKLAYDGLRRPVEEFLERNSPDWVLCDFATYWLGPVAARCGVPTAFFSVFPAVFLGFIGPPEVLMYGDGRQNPGWVPFETGVGLSPFQLERARGVQDDGVRDDGVQESYRFGATVLGCDAVVVRSCLDFEPEWLPLLGEMYRKPVIPTGILPATATEDFWPETRAWLDNHEKGSVVYIGFGTETKPSQYELTQLALGLELSELPFYWVLLRRRGPSDDDVIELPDGFEERTRGRGVVCTGWGPQFQILSHDSVGLLLIHSGMGSLVEGLQLGKPLVLLPFTADQAIIASYLAEKKMGHMIPRDESDGSFTPDLVAESLSLVMASEEGKVYRDKAKEMMTSFGDVDKQNNYVDNLLAHLATSL